MKSQENKKESGSHVIEKIRRISISMDRGEFWSLVFIVGLAVFLIGGFIYYVFL